MGAKGEGRFERISWDEALDNIAARLKAIAAEFGPEAILPYSYAGTMGLLNGSGMDRRFFHRLGASRLDRTICSSAGGAGLTEALGLRYGTEPEQFRHARLILAWGANILGTNVHLWPFIVEARRNGAKFYTIDPRRNRTGAAADKHFFINPGSDTALALAMMHVIIGEKPVRRRLRRAAYHRLRRAGASASRSIRRERAAALTGIADGRDRGAGARIRHHAAGRDPAELRRAAQRARRHGGAHHRAAAGADRLVERGRRRLAAFHFAGLSVEPRRPGAPRSAIARAGPRGAPREHVGAGPGADRSSTDPPVKALVVYNSNPAAIAPNQNAVLRGLARDDLFTVVLEQFQNDTADYADILLPATTFLEHTDLYLAYGHYYLQLARPALRGAGRGEVERGGLPAAGRAHGLRRRLLRRFGRRHDPHAARFAASVRARHHARRTGPRAFRAAARGACRRAVPAVRRRRLRNAIRQVPFPRGVARLHAARGIAARRRAACGRDSRWS